MSDTVIHATDADFESAVLQSDEPVLVDFWAQWCGPCKMIAPALDQIATEYAGKAKVVKVDVDANQATALKYHVRSIPMLLLFKGGRGTRGAGRWCRCGKTSTGPAARQGDRPVRFRR